MKFTIKKLTIICLCLFAFSCKEDTLLKYNSDESGTHIYFLEKFNRTSADHLMRVISLGTTPISKQDSVLKIPVRITGSPISKDRPINVLVADTSSMKEGLHYDFLNEPVLRANRVVDTISIVLHRTEDLRESRAYMLLELKANEYLGIDIATKLNNPTQDLLSYAISFDDMFPVPHLWTTFAGKTTVIKYFGDYSRRKVELMLDVLKVDPIWFYDSTKRLGTVQLIGWSSYMKKWLLDQKNAGNTQYDENGQEITMGTSAN